MIVQEYMLRLIKQQIDELLAKDQQLQVFLSWVSQKSSTVPTEKKPVIVRAFYFDLTLAHVLDVVGDTLDLTRAFDRNFTCNLDRSLAIDLTLDRVLALDKVVDLTVDPNLVFECVLDRAIAHARTLDPQLQRALEQLKEQPPNLARDRSRFKQWWEANGENWTEQLRSVMIKYRHIGHDWQFSNQQKDALKQYYNSNSLLLDCLNSERYMMSTVREEIKKTLLLPIAKSSLPDLPK